MFLMASYWFVSMVMDQLTFFVFWPWRMAGLAGSSSSPALFCSNPVSACCLSRALMLLYRAMVWLESDFHTRPLLGACVLTVSLELPSPVNWYRRR